MIVALFVMSLVAAAAVAMIVRAHIDTRRTELLLNADQATLYAQGSVNWAIDQLNRDWEQQKPSQLIDRTPIHSKTDHFNGYQVESTIEDMQAYFNINNLQAIEYQDDFVRLLQTVNPQIETETAKEITLAVRDWITPIIKNSGLDKYYTGLNPPYRAPHHLMVSISELRLIKGITPDLFNRLSPYVAALPDTTPINFNSAPALVFMSLSATLTIEAANAIAVYRQKSPFIELQKFLDFDIVKNNPIPPGKLTATSSYFLVKTNVTVGQQRIILYTLLVRTAQETKSRVAILWQTKGTL